MYFVTLAHEKGRNKCWTKVSQRVAVDLSCYTDSDKIDQSVSALVISYN